jgi:hypothetical protein
VSETQKLKQLFKPKDDNEDLNKNRKKEKEREENNKLIKIEGKVEEDESSEGT